MKVGDTVEFLEHVYSPPYTPYYDAYKGHQFRVEKFMVDEGKLIRDHVWVVCLTDPSVIVKGYVHTYDMRLVTTH